MVDFRGSYRSLRNENKPDQLLDRLEDGAMALMAAPRSKGRGSSRNGDGQGRYLALQDLDEHGNAINTGDEEIGRSGRVPFGQRRRCPVGLFLIFAVALITCFAFFGFHASLEKERERDREQTLFSNGTHNFHRTTILVSLDGFHPHYASPERTPNLDKFIHENAAVPYMHPSFPTQTFPNHWTLATGLYPMNHGIVGNSFYDPKLGEEFVHSDPSKSLKRGFWGGEPIWTTARKQGLISAVHMWPGSEVDWGTAGPNYVDPFVLYEKLDVKRNRIFEWLDYDIDERPELIMCYVPNIDTMGHKVGISGPELENSLSEVDSFVGTVVQGIEARNLTSIVNLVVVSDHGMAPTSNERLVFLDDHIDMSLITRQTGWPLAGLRFESDAYVPDIKANLTAHIDPSTAYVFLSSDMPPEWHFSPSSPFGHRIPPLYVVPRLGWSILTHPQYSKMDFEYRPKGVHGYNSTAVLMRALFVAGGPSFEPGKYEPFPNVNIYSIVCRSLGITPARNDGQIMFDPLRTSFDDVYPDTPFAVDFLPGNSTFSQF